MHKVALLFLALTPSLVLIGCGGRPEGMSRVQLQIAPSGTPTNALQFAQVGSGGDPTSVVATLCFKRLRFKRFEGVGHHSQPGSDDNGHHSNDDDSNGIEDNIDLDIGSVTLNAAGVNLGEVDVPIGDYGRIEFDLEDDCDDSSVQVTNSFVNNLKTDDHIKIKFVGRFTAQEADQVLTLGFDSVRSALAGVTQPREIRPALTSLSGRF